MKNPLRPHRKHTMLTAMELFWRLGNIPELAALSDRVRRQVHVQSVHRYIRMAPINWQTARLMMASIGMVLGLVLGGIVLGSTAPTSGFSLLPLWAIGGSGLTYLVRLQLEIAIVRPHYHEFITDSE